MGWSILLGVMIAIATGTAAVAVPVRLRPDLAARLITGLVLVCVAAASWTLLLVLTENVAELHGVAELLARCCSSMTATHRDTFTPVGIAALGIAALAAFSAGRALRRRETCRRPLGEAPNSRSSRPMTPWPTRCAAAPARSLCRRGCCARSIPTNVAC